MATLVGRLDADGGQIGGQFQGAPGVLQPLQFVADPAEAGVQRLPCPLQFVGAGGIGTALDPQPMFEQIPERILDQIAALQRGVGIGADIVRHPADHTTHPTHPVTQAIEGALQIVGAVEQAAHRPLMAAQAVLAPGQRGGQWYAQREQQAQGEQPD